MRMIDKEGKLSGQAKEQVEAYRKRFTDILELFGLMNNAFNAITKMGPAGWRTLAQALLTMGGSASHSENRIKAKASTSRKSALKSSA